MTAATELLPLPEPVVVAEELEFGAIYAYERRHMEAYARANMEPLRAEVAEWKRVAAAQAELHGEAEERAERLAEALRMFLQAGVGNSTDFYVQHNATLAARDALAQEDRND